MTRVRADDYDTKKRHILDKAAALFARNGFDHASMLDVAQACGASKSHVYHYFPSKEDLLYEILIAYITRQAAELADIVALPEPADERFRRFVDSFMRGAARSRHEHVMLMNDLKFLPRAQREDIHRLESELMTMLIGLLREINPAAMAEQQMGKPYALLLFGMMIWTFSWYRRNGPVSPAELAERIAELFTGGFRSLAPRPPAG